MRWIPNTETVDQYLAPPDVHEASRARAPGAALAFALTCVLLVAHGANLYFALPDSPWLAFALHTLLVIITAVLVRVAIVGHRDARFFMILLISTAFLSAFGAMGTLLCILFNLWDSRSALPFAAWFSSIFPTETQRLPETIYENILIGRDETSRVYAVVPFMDVMEVGSESQKREAISRMAERFEPAFAPAFRRALQDESNTIRVQAATAVVRIEHQFSARLMDLTGLYRRMPRDPSVVLALAQHYDAHAFTGILDDQRERANRADALRLYREFIALMPRDEQARIHIGRLMLRDGDAPGAADWLASCVREGFRSEALMLWYAEALYAAKRYGELRAIAGQGLTEGALVGNLRSEKPEISESLALWAGTPNVSEAA